MRGSWTGLLFILLLINVWGIAMNLSLLTTVSGTLDQNDVISKSKKSVKSNTYTSSGVLVTKNRLKRLEKRKPKVYIRYVEIQQPAANAYVRGTITIEVYVSEDDPNDPYAGDLSVKFYVDDRYIGCDNNLDGDHYYYCTWDTTNDIDGHHVICVEEWLYKDSNTQLIDKDNISVIVDNTCPNVEITSPQNGSYVSEVCTILVNADDNMGIKEVEFYVDGSLIGEDTATPYECSWDTSSWDDGTHTVKVIAYDYAEHTSVDSLVVIVDNTRPVVEISAPAEHYVNSTWVNIIWFGYDNYGIGYYELRIDNSSWIYISPNSCCNYNVSLPDGLHVIHIRAVDLVGNVGSSSINIFVDTIAPTIGSVEYPEGICVGSTIELVANISDAEPSSGIDVVYLYYSFDNETWSFIEMELANSSYVATLNISEKKVLVQVVAVDKAGNVGKSDIILIEAQVPPTTMTTPRSPVLLFIIMGAIAGGAIIALALCLGARRRY